MIDVIDSFKKVHQIAIKSLFGKAELRRVLVTGSHTRKIDSLIMNFQVTPFRCLMFKKFAQKKKHQNEQYLPQSLNQKIILSIT